MAKGEVRNVDWLVNHSRESWRSAFDQTERRHDDQVNTIDPLVPLDLVQQGGCPLLQVGDLHWPPAGVDWQSGIPDNSRWVDAHLARVQVVNWAGTGTGDNGERRDLGWRSGHQMLANGPQARLQGGALVTPPGQVHLSRSYFSWRSSELLLVWPFTYWTELPYQWQLPMTTKLQGFLKGTKISLPWSGGKVSVKGWQSV